jgi:transposase
VFQLHAVDVHGKTGCRKTLSRSEMLPFDTNLPSGLVGIEACAGSHYWARELIKLGHDVRLMAAQFVSPYRKSGKNDANDAEAKARACSNVAAVALAANPETDSRNACIIWAMLSRGTEYRVVA